MTNNTIIVVRHAIPQINKNKTPSKWELSEEGWNQARKLANNKLFSKVEVIITSGELKAIQTAEPLARKLGITIVQNNLFNEVERKGSFVPYEFYCEQVEKMFNNLDEETVLLEQGRKAMTRIKRGLELLDENYCNKKILIVSHGLLMNLLFARLKKRKHRAFACWQKTTFCSYGIIKDYMVLKDIVPQNYSEQ